MKGQVQTDETGQCVVCGRESVFRFDPTIITTQLTEAWGISDRLVEANRKESMFCGSCGSSLRVRRSAAVLMQTFAERTGLSCKSFAELLENKEFQDLKIAEINAWGPCTPILRTTQISPTPSGCVMLRWAKCLTEFDVRIFNV